MTEEFKAFEKIARWNRGVLITEKLDGTNACIVIKDGKFDHAQSRKRTITPEADNFGFAGWVSRNEEFLVETLGEGYHYGEWWGNGIQRRYDMERKMFSLFNVSRWKGLRDYDKAKEIGLSVVPILWEGNLDDFNVNAVMAKLKATGSIAAPGFMNPEGIVIFHSQNYALFKKTFEYDEKGKGTNKQTKENKMPEMKQTWFQKQLAESKYLPVLLPMLCLAGAFFTLVHLM